MKRSPLHRNKPLARNRAPRPSRKPKHTKAEQEHLIAVANLGCLVCGAGAEIHHVRRGQGLGQRASHMEVLPLCFFHHRTGPLGVAFHAGSRAWQAIHGTEQELLAIVAGKLGLGVAS